MAKRTPAALKVLRNTDRKDRQRKSAKKKTDERVWSTVIQLSDDEKLVFRRIADYMRDKKLWRSPYSELLAHYVRITHLLNDALVEMESRGMIQVFRNKTRNVSPEFSAYTKLLEKQTDLASSMGFTPKSWKAISGVDISQLSLFSEDEGKTESPLRSAR